jgi:hypothetical protein
MNKPVRHDSSSYINQVFGSPKEYRDLVRKSRRWIKQNVQNISEIGYFACTGISGLSVAAPLSYLMGKGLMVVRKSSEDSHCQTNVEGIPVRGSHKVLIIDDLICSGTTIRDIVSKVSGRVSSGRRHPDLNIDIVGTFLYNRLVDDDPHPFVSLESFFAYYGYGTDDNS